MENTIHLATQQVKKHPLMAIASGVVILLSLINFFIAVSQFFSGINTAFSFINYIYNFNSFMTFVRLIVVMILLLFFVLTTLGTIALFGMLFLYVTGCLPKTKAVNLVLFIAAAAASNVIPFVLSLVCGYFSFYMMGLVLPMNLAAVAAALFILYHERKGKKVNFSVLALVLGGVQILFAIIGLFGAITYFTFQDFLLFILGIVSGVTGAFLACMAEKKITGAPVQYVDSLITKIDGIQFTTTTANVGAPTNVQQPVQPTAPAAPQTPVQPTAPVQNPAPEAGSAPSEETKTEE